MQRIVAVQGGVKCYSQGPLQVLTNENRTCPFCEVKHRLRQHGSYPRLALFSDQPNCRLMIWRLYCPYARQTLSLLPDFCLPRRQQGPAVLAVFLFALVFLNRTLAEAMRSARFDLRQDLARPDLEVVSLHSKAQSLRDAFQQRLDKLKAYLSGFHPRIEQAPAGVRGAHQRAAEVINLMRIGFQSTTDAFIHHGRIFHRTFELGLC